MDKPEQEQPITPGTLALEAMKVEQATRAVQVAHNAEARVRGHNKIRNHSGARHGKVRVICSAGRYSC